MAELEQTTPVEQATDAPVAVVPAKKKKNKRSVSHGQVHINATFNNTIVTVTDGTGGVIAQASAGASGFRGSKKGTAYAAQVAVDKAITTAKQNHGFSKADVYVKGIGQGRDAAIRAIAAQNISIESIKDKTGVPHGGCRPKKARRN